VKNSIRRAATGFALAAFVGLGGTQMGGCPLGGEGSFLIVVNNPDTFTVTLMGVDYSGTLNRTWSCSAPQANLSIGGMVVTGWVHIIILDNNGTTVYDNIHGASIGGVAVPTMPGGAPGNWQISMTFSNASWIGAISLTADSPPKPDSISIGMGIGGSGSLTLYAGWSAGPVSVSMASALSTGTIRVRLWDPSGAPLYSAPPIYDKVIGPVIGAVSDNVTGALAGVWKIQLDISGASMGSAIDLTN
jgi:hypothetical protein